MSSYLVDTEINEQVIPPRALEKAERLWRGAHGEMHRGHYMEMFTQYVDGLADGMEVSASDLQEFIADLARQNV